MQSLSCGRFIFSLQRQFDCDKLSLFYCTVLPRVHRAVKAECILQNVFISACASARGSLKCSFIHKYTVQGETSDELFRFFPMPEEGGKKVSFRGPLKGL